MLNLELKKVLKLYEKIKKTSKQVVTECAQTVSQVLHFLANNRN